MAKAMMAKNINRRVKTLSIRLTGVTSAGMVRITPKIQ